MFITQFTTILLNEFPVALDSLVSMGFRMMACVLLSRTVMILSLSKS